jgi:hypothetical protein
MLFHECETSQRLKIKGFLCININFVAQTSSATLSEILGHNTTLQTTNIAQFVQSENSSRQTSLV